MIHKSGQLCPKLVIPTFNEILFLMRMSMVHMYNQPLQVGSQNMGEHPNIHNSLSDHCPLLLLLLHAYLKRVRLVTITARSEGGFKNYAAKANLTRAHIFEIYNTGIDVFIHKKFTEHQVLVVDYNTPCTMYIEPSGGCNSIIRSINYFEIMIMCIIIYVAKQNGLI